VIRILFLFVFFTAQLNAQTITWHDDSLKVLGQKILKGKTEAEKVSANSRFITLLKKDLSQSGSFDHRYDSVLNIAKLYSPDMKFRILNWNMQLEDGTFQYFGFIQTHDKLIELIDRTNEIKSPETTVLPADKWYGAHYYNIIKSGKRKKAYYLLLGWKGTDRTLNKKVIDVVKLDSKGNPTFGASVFSVPKKDPKRIIFQYSAEVTMSLKYYPRSQKIIFDHLSPRASDLVGQYQYYAPDLSYDCLKRKRNKWVLVEDIDARNEDSPADHKYNAPK
jgi:hypothetical protein